MSVNAEMASLYRWSATAPEPLAGQFRLPPEQVHAAAPICGFAYTPSDFLMIGLDEHGAAWARGRTGDLKAFDLSADVYEFRLFCADWELRWRREGGLVRMALLSEAPLSDDRLGFGDMEAKVPKHVVPMDNRYLVWGEPDDEQQADGWTKLATARIGTLWIPCRAKRWVPCRAKSRVALRTREYFFQPPGSCGNWAFLTERLIGFGDVVANKEATHDEALS